MLLRLRAIGLTLVVMAASACAANPTPNRRPSSTANDVGADAIGCLDTLHASDTVETIVKMTAASQDPKTTLPPNFENFLAQGFQARFKAPSKLPLSVVVGDEPCDSLGSRCAGGILDIGAVAYVTAHSDGSLVVTDVVDETLTGDFADSIRSALGAMAKNRDVPWLDRADSIPLVLRFAPDDQADTVPEARYIFRAKIPRYDLPFSYAMMPSTGIVPKYPSRAAIAGIEDSVMLAFTVRANGSIAPQSMDFVSGNYREFVLSAADALNESRYHPAHLGDCAVATRIRQRFVFKSPH
ncbi:MAG TPA: energy transducer TonB [Gemmatimonadaceae bacterium]